jgi:hypothetical protein
MLRFPRPPTSLSQSRIQRLEELIHTAAYVAADLREQKYLSQQIEAQGHHLREQDPLRALRQEM